jgi:hypothetical protein
MANGKWEVLAPPRIEDGAKLRVPCPLGCYHLVVPFLVLVHRIKYQMIDQGPPLDAQCPSWAASLGYMGVAAAVCLSNCGSAVSIGTVLVPIVTLSMSVNAESWRIRFSGLVSLDSWYKSSTSASTRCLYLYLYLSKNRTRTRYWCRCRSFWYK